MKLPQALENILFLDIETVPEATDFGQLNKEVQNLYAAKTAYKRKADDLSTEDYYDHAGIWAEFGKIVCISVGYVTSTTDGRQFRVCSFSLEDPYSLHNWDVSSVTDMSNMFQYGGNIITPFLDNWDVSKVTDMSFMFSHTMISDYNSFINWDVSNVVNMSNMFNSFDMDIPIGMWDVSNVENMEKMMCYINSYSTYGGDGYNLNNWDVNKVTNCSDFSFFRSHGFSLPNFTNCDS